MSSSCTVWRGRSVHRLAADAAEGLSAVIAYDMHCLRNIVCMDTPFANRRFQSPRQPLYDREGDGIGRDHFPDGGGSENR